MAEIQSEFIDPSPFQLSSRQQQVSDLLKDIQSPDYPFSDWYYGALFAAKNHYNPDRFPQAAHSMRELLEKLPRIIAVDEIQKPRPDFRKIRKGMMSLFERVSEKYGRELQGQVINGELEELILMTKRYLEQNKIPDRWEQAGSLVAKLDPLHDVLNPQIRDGKAKLFKKLWDYFEGVVHHKQEIEEEYFWQRIAQAESMIIDLLAPITAQDQGAIQALISKQHPDDEEVKKLIELIKRRGANSMFFFKTADNPAWIKPLKENGFFQSPPDVETTEEGSVLVRYWWPIEYLKKASAHSPSDVVRTILEFKKTDNPRVLREIVSIACDLPEVDISLELLPFVKQYLTSSRWWGDQELIVNILKKWGQEPGPSREAAFYLTKYVVAFQPDPKQEEKRLQRLEDPQAWDTLPKPMPRFDSWEYQQILEKGIRFLSERDPYTVACTLINAVNHMIRYSLHKEYLDQGLDEDLSEIWCRRLNEPDPDLQDSDQTLVNTLTYACEQVYERDPEAIDMLDQLLRDQRWKVFKRLRQHLFAKYPSEHTLPWIRKFIIEHSDYSEWKHHYEFQLMIREASEHFGSRLLSAEDLSVIVDAILGGPSEEKYREHLGDLYSEENFQKYQKYFHRTQLRPFVSILSEKHKRYFDELGKDEVVEAITDDSYSPVGESEGGTVSYISPKTKDELQRYTDEELLDFLNDWEDEHRDEKDWLLEINIPALSHVFQELFKEDIIPNQERLEFWIANRGRIARPIHITAMVNAMNELVKVNQFDYLDQWLEFCEWILSHPDGDRDEDQTKTSDESKDHPNWRSSRRAVVSFIESCLSDNSETPITARAGLTKLLQRVCMQLDWRLDYNHPVILNQDDSITEAINCTRSLAIESLIHFGFWIRRYFPEDPVAEVIDVLSNRLENKAEYPLTQPEHAMLGRHFGNLFALNRDWAVEHREAIFPNEELAIWWNAFGSYIRFNHPHRTIFEFFGLNMNSHLTEGLLLIATGKNGIRLLRRLGQHLFIYFLWELFPLKGEESLLASFYNSSSSNRESWAQLFDTVGLLLHNHGPQWDQKLVDSATDYFQWRLEAAEPKELGNFANWLEAECLDPVWRLQSFSKVLDVTTTGDLHLYREVKVLNSLLPENLPLVIECFEKITRFIDQSTQTYLPPEEAKSILRAGLHASDSQVHKNAKRAQENLLRHGRSDFLNIG